MVECRLYQASSKALTHGFRLNHTPGQKRAGGAAVLAHSRTDRLLVPMGSLNHSFTIRTAISPILAVSKLSRWTQETPMDWLGQHMRDSIGNSDSIDSSQNILSFPGAPTRYDGSEPLTSYPK